MDGCSTAARLPALPPLRAGRWEALPAWAAVVVREGTVRLVSGRRAARAAWQEGMHGGGSGCKERPAAGGSAAAHLQRSSLCLQAAHNRSWDCCKRMGRGWGAIEGGFWGGELQAVRLKAYGNE